MIDRTWEILGTRMANVQVNAINKEVNSQFLRNIVNRVMHLRFLGVVGLPHNENEEQVAAWNCIHWKGCEKNKAD